MILLLLIFAPASIDFEAYRFIATHPPKKCETERPTGYCPHVANRKVLFTALFSYEVDTLNIVAEEYAGLADIMIAENRQIHNPHTNKRKPFYMTKYVNYSNVFSARCISKRSGTEMFEVEDANNDCLRRLTPKGYDIVIVGSIDEMLSRRNVYRLKYCALPKLPTGSAISMPLGLVGRSFRTDWHYPRFPFSFSLPSIYYGNNIGTRHFAPMNNPPMIGGIHLTNYCYLPVMVIKENWTTDSKAAFNTADFCSKSIEVHKKNCYGMLKNRVRAGTGPEFEMPEAFKTCDYPAWFGKLDPREVMFYQMICKSDRNREF